MRYVLFWDITQCMVVIPNQNFGTTYWSHLQRSRNPRSKLFCWEGCGWWSVPINRGASQ